MTLDQIPGGPHTLITVTPQQCKLIDYIMGKLALMFPSIDQDLTLKAVGLPNVIEPSDTIVLKKIDLNTHKSRDDRTRRVC